VVDAGSLRLVAVVTPTQRTASAAATRASVERDPAEPGYMKLTPTQRLHEVTMAAMSRPAAPPESSVSFTRNAKGVTQVEITVRDPSAADAFDIARALYDKARTAYPLPSGYVGAEG
jgi:hypothetical protein